MALFQSNTPASINTIRLKRQVTIKTRVTDSFRTQAKQELSQEVANIEKQLNALDNEYQRSLQSLEGLAQQGHQVRPQLEQLNAEAQAKRNQLTGLKVEVTQQLANVDRAENGALVVTGLLESFVDVAVGENIFQRIQGATVIIEDGVVAEIEG